MEATTYNSNEVIGRFGGSVKVDVKKLKTFNAELEKEERLQKKRTTNSNFHIKQKQEKAIEKESAKRKIDLLQAEYNEATTFTERRNLLADINFYRLKIKGSWIYNVKTQDNDTTV